MTIKQPEILTIEPLFRVNGAEYRPLPYTERARQVQAIQERREAVEASLARLDTATPDEADELVTEFLANCMASFEYWCDHFCFTFDPRDRDNPYKRFILYQYQRDVAAQTIECIRKGRNVLEDKSRDMGASWLKMAVFTWMWLFDESFHCLMGSRKEDLVDDFTIDSLFGKIDCIIERLPPWMIRGYSKAKHRKKLRIEHPCGSLITGESANRDFGRGPRKNVVYLDEFAFWEYDSMVWTSIGDTAPCCIVTSTPCGEVNQFARLRFGSDSGVHVITMHWTAHPAKDVSWYNREVARRKGNLVSIAQELNIDYKASAGRLAFPELLRLKNSIVMPRVLPNDPVNAGYTLYGSLDWGSTNPSSFHVYRVVKIGEHPRRFRIDSIYEYYKPSTLKEVAEAIKGCPYYPLLRTIYCDPSMFFFNQQDTLTRATTSLALQLRDYYRVFLTGGRRGDTLAMEKVREMWSDDRDPLLRISEECVWQLKELEGLRYVTQTAFMASKRNVPESLVDKDNHSWDELKYFLNSLYDANEEVVPQGPPMPAAEWLKAELATLRKTKVNALALPKRVQHRRRLFSY